MKIKFETWLEKDDIIKLDKYAEARGMSRSAASSDILLNYLKQQDAQAEQEIAQDIEIDPQLKEVRDAVIALDKMVENYPEIDIPYDVDPIIAIGVRDTVTENMLAMGLDIEQYKEFIEVAVRTKIQSLCEGDAPGTKELIDYYYSKYYPGYKRENHNEQRA